MRKSILYGFLGLLLASKSYGFPAATTTTKSVFKYYDKCVNPKHWAMTYDDGPYIYDSALLDLLKKYNVKATFFLIGTSPVGIESAEAKASIKRMFKEGHLVENHTYSHTDITTLTAEQLKQEMLKVEDKIFEYTGKRSALMRPPFGAGESSKTVTTTLSDLGYTAAVKWNADVMDWGNSGDIDYALKIFDEATSNDGSVISLNHLNFDGITKEKLVNLAKAEIEYMLKKGYKPVTMDVCLGLKPYKN